MSTSVPDAKIPRVKILVAGTNPERSKYSNQEYGNYDVVLQTDKYNAATFFNKELQNQKDVDIFIYMTSKHFFTTKNSLEKIIKSFHEDSTIGAAYCDLYFDDGIIKFYMPNPSYNINTIFNSSGVAFNIPIFIKTAAAPQFDENLNTLYFKDIIRSLASRMLLKHIASPEISITELDSNIEQDLKYLNDKSPLHGSNQQAG